MMRFLGYSWDILLNLVAILVVLKLLSLSYSTVDQAIILVLVLIYITIISSSAAMGYSNLKSLQAYAHEFRKLHILIKREDDEEGRHEEKMLGKTVKNAEIKYIINSIFTFIIYLIVVFNLIIL